MRRTDFGPERLETPEDEPAPSRHRGTMTEANCARGGPDRLPATDETEPTLAGAVGERQCAARLAWGSALGDRCQAASDGGVAPD